MKKAFTLVEIMICVVIFGLLLSMGIPAFHKVKYNSIEKRIKQGVRVEKEEMEYYKRHKTENKSNTYISTKVEEEVKLDNNEYIVIRDKEQIKEVIIDGQTVYLIKKLNNP
jgi:prepilin-type N-terminal cleavage/methylation domain-containing protein